MTREHGVKEPYNPRHIRMLVCMSYSKSILFIFLTITRLCILVFQVVRIGGK
ncbi:hypothetical protein Hanom_Chr12g01070941 [Helianthus anomalus]